MHHVPIVPLALYIIVDIGCLAAIGPLVFYAVKWNKDTYYKAHLRLCDGSMHGSTHGSTQHIVEQPGTANTFDLNALARRAGCEPAFATFLHPNGTRSKISNVGTFVGADRYLDCDAVPGSDRRYMAYFDQYVKNTTSCDFEIDWRKSFVKSQESMRNGAITGACICACVVIVSVVFACIAKIGQYRIDNKVLPV
jgi:hypothetical protein